MRGARAVAFLLGAAVPLGLFALTAACGARSGLFLSPYLEEGGVTGDGALPGIDVAPIDVVVPSACADASDTLIYTVTTGNSLLVYDPTSQAFTRIGTLTCPDSEGRTPFSMAVDRQGNAYVLYYAAGSTTPGSIFKVDLQNASCAATAFVPGQSGFLGFGMGFTADAVGGGETLYVASNDTPSRLGAINEQTLALSVVGSLPSNVVGAELTGTGEGRLYTFFAPDFVANGGPNTGPTALGEIDKTNATLIAQNALPGIEQGDGWAFAFWGGNFYFFTAPPDEPGTIVQEFDLATGVVTPAGSYGEVIDGAGVSTCAPVQ